MLGRGDGRGEEAGEGVPDLLVLAVVFVWLNKVLGLLLVFLGVVWLNEVEGMLVEAFRLSGVGLCLVDLCAVLEVGWAVG